MFNFHTPPRFDEAGRPLPRYTIVARINGETFNVGVSRCSSRDHYHKKKGAAIAEGRAEKRPFETIGLPPEGAMKMFNEYCENLINYHQQQLDEYVMGGNHG